MEASWAAAVGIKLPADELYTLPNATAQENLNM
jgi:hypothetical protein